MAALESVKDLNLRLGIQSKLHMIKLIKNASYLFYHTKIIKRPTKNRKNVKPSKFWKRRMNQNKYNFMNFIYLKSTFFQKKSLNLYSFTEYKTAPNFIQLSQKLLISVFFPVFARCDHKIVLFWNQKTIWCQFLA